MANLTPEEVLEIRNELDELRPHFEASLELVASAFNSYRKQAGKFLIRAIIPRDPKIKELPRIMKKIRKAREGGQNIGIRDLGDIIGLKVLCPYPSDVDEVIGWMENNDMFQLLTPRGKAKRDSETGYRGYNFDLTFPEETLRIYPYFRGLKCEVQIKTMLQEAWDAWTHDVVYDPETEKSPEEGHKHLFRLLADELMIVDKKSEVLKSQILKEARAAERRRRAAAVMYFTEAKPFLATFGIADVKPLKRSELKTVAARLDEYVRENGVSSIVCKSTMLIGLIQNDPYYENLALQHAESFVRSNVTFAEAYAVKASVCWARGDFDDAIQLTERAIELAEANEVLSKNRKLVDWKGNYAYWVGEALCAGTLENPGPRDRAITYMQEIMTNPLFSAEPGFKDTMGFLEIVLGEDREAVNRGRRLIEEARLAVGGEAVDLAESFFVKHECLALAKLDRLVGRS